MNPGAWFGRELTWKLFTCVSRYKVWEVRVTLDCGYVILVAQSGGWGKCLKRDVNNRHCGNVTQDPGLRGGHLDTVDIVPSYRV